MNANNVILNLPFDEPNGSAKAYDYSQSRADGDVVGAEFAKGNNGNAILFPDGIGKCEVSKNILPNLSGNFTMMCFVQNKTCECGSPRKLIWLVAFSGEKNYIEAAIDVNPGSWIHLAVTKQGTAYRFYVNSQLVKAVSHTGTPTGISLNQDYYGGDCLGFGLLDDLKVYNIALSQQEIIEETASQTTLTYLLDGVNLKSYGVYVSGSDGVVDRPKLKTPKSISWDNYHGEVVDLEHKFYEPREITLSCFIKAKSKQYFVQRCSDFEHLFDKKGTQRLSINVHPVKPLVYEVYCKDSITISKTWNESLMVGTFKIKLIEPDPVKRVLKHTVTSNETRVCTIDILSLKYCNIYWGDGTVDMDVAGSDEVQHITHTFDNTGEYFPIITGCIDEIQSFETNAIIVWNKL